MACVTRVGVQCSNSFDTTKDNSTFYQSFVPQTIASVLTQQEKKERKDSLEYYFL